MTKNLIISKDLVSPQVQIISKADFIEEYRYPANSNLHKLTYDVDPTFIFSLRGVAIAGRGYIMKEDSWLPIFKLEDLHLFPTYVEYFFNAQKKTHPIYAFLNKKLMPIKIEAVTSIIHFNYIYGHFLLEILPKLFILKEFFKPENPIPPLALPTDLPSWLKKHILEFWGDWEIIWFNPDEEYISADKTFIVTNDITQRFFSKWARHYLSFAEQSNSEISQKIFITRPNNHATFRVLANFNALRMIAIDNGYKVIEPSTLGNLQKQAGLFNRSSIILGEYTSALHNTLFSPQGTYIGCLNYLPSQIQDYISAVQGHNLNYLVSEDGPVVVKNLLEPREYIYTISEKKFIKLINDIENAIKNRDH